MFKIQKLDFLISFYIGCIAVSELMGAKTFPVWSVGSFHLSASTGIFVVPLIYAINDIITEVFGKDRARSIVRSGLVVIGFFLLFSLLATSLPPSALFASSEKSYDAVFGLSIRIAAASLIAFGIAEFLDVFIFAGLRKRFGKKRLWLRTNVSNFLSQFIDTSVFIILAFYAVGHPLLGNMIFLFGLILPYWLLKCFMSVIETPLVYIGVKWLRKESKK